MREAFRVQAQAQTPPRAVEPRRAAAIEMLRAVGRLEEDGFLQLKVADRAGQRIDVQREFLHPRLIIEDSATRPAVLHAIVHVVRPVIRQVGAKPAQAVSVNAADPEDRSVDPPEVVKWPANGMPAAIDDDAAARASITANAGAAS